MSSKENKATSQNWYGEKPSLTKVLRDEIERGKLSSKQSVDTGRTIPDEHAIQGMSIEALEFLWHSTATGYEVRDSDQHDWCSALDLLGTKEAGASRKSQAVTHDPSWPVIIELLRRVSVRPLVQHAFVREWMLSSARQVPRALRPDFVQIFFPTYKGSALTLYRGCMPGHERGLSWTDAPDVARKFARSFAVKGDALLIETNATADAIIGDTRSFVRKSSEREVVVDPEKLGPFAVLENQPQCSPPRRQNDVWSNCVTRKLLSSYHKKLHQLRREELSKSGIR